MRKILIADCNEDYRAALTDALQNAFHVLCCRNGAEAWALLQQEKPDIFILDLMLPELDGLTLLEQVRAAGLHPLVLAVTPLFSPYVFQSVQRLGIDYLIRKPCTIDAIASRARDLSQRLNIAAPCSDPETYVTNVLLSLHLSTKHKGFFYLRKAILLMAKDPAQSVTKELYPAVAHSFGTNTDNVERAIRTALDYAWKNGSRSLWYCYFSDGSQRPSNAVFISRITEALLRNE